MSRRSTTVLTAFNSGVFSPRLNGRIDIESSRSALRTAANFVVRQSGALTRRAGLQYIAAVATEEPAIPDTTDMLLWQSQVAFEAFVPLDDQPFL